MNLDRNISKPNIPVSKPNIQIPRQNVLTDEQRERLNKTKQDASQKINQGTSFIDTNLLNRFRNKNYNAQKLKNINNNYSIFDTFKMVISEIFDYFLEYMPEFSIKLGIMIIAVLAYFSLGGAMLYICKISQTNFLPVFSDCFPYSNTKVELNDITTNIFERSLNDEKISMNLKFKFEDNNKNILLDTIRKYKTSNKSNVIIIYLLSIVNALFNYNYNFINTVFSNVNDLNELLIIILSPIIYIISFIFLFFSNNVYFIFLWFYKMSWFFKMNTNCDNKKGKANWVPVEMMYNPMKFYIGCILTFIACMFSIGVMISLIINPVFSLPSLTMIYSMISSMLFTGQIKNEQVNIFTIIGYIFKYYKLPMFLMTCFFTIFRSNISEKIFKLYENYNLKKTSMLSKFGENLMKINKDINKMNDFSNKMDILNVRDRVDIIGIDKTMDENTRKLQNQINNLKVKNRKLTNTQNKIADKLEDAYNINTPFTIVVLSILFAVISSLGFFNITDYRLFSPVVNFQTNDVECDGESEDSNNDHTSIYKTYMLGKSLFNTFKNAANEKKEMQKKNAKLNPNPNKEALSALKTTSINNYNNAAQENPLPNTNREMNENTNTSPNTNANTNANTKSNTNTKNDKKGINKKR